MMGIRCRRLTFVRPSEGSGRHTILDHVDADFVDGRINLVTGETGTGKSTLMHLLGGLLRPTSGEIIADACPVSRYTAPHRDRWRRQVGMVFQDLRLIADLSVLENVMLPAVPRGFEWGTLLSGAHRVLERLGLAALANQPIDKLSGGQQQRVVMARAMMCAPRFLLLDEPTSFQDDRSTRMLLSVWRTLVADGVCLVICSHDLRLRAAREVGPHWILDRGRLELVE
jgi:lipoprotein-releasing system ATP-binding protein